MLAQGTRPAPNPLIQLTSRKKRYLFNVLFTLAAFVTAAAACKCGGNKFATEGCYQTWDGIIKGNDCAANSISERLSTFAQCCRAFGVISDCRYPVGCAKRELEAARATQGLPPLKNSEILAKLENYEG
ncbi:hypothetical protein MAPG_05605 [Magnaporthiopsis poae ATCC 64411]|uniref:Uncharacterized protein n=1 Tax=Magnaporthiopsis poae (strain ATCC 64411 / 73-15) TaxID=644358 RepID=A0A0C4DZU7_MAGP6|nr:hypothetical protein MAPG_05605 [Magnaporthiopsis poae ATCC 64411]